MPVYTIQTPNGRKLKIEAADEATALRGAQEWASKNTGKRSLIQEATGAMANFNRGAGVLDEMAAGFDMLRRDPMQAIAPGPTALLRAVTGRGGQQRKTFDAAMAQQRAPEDDFAARRPKAAALARGTGMAATAAVPTGTTLGLAANSSRAVNMARGATVAGLEGAGYAAADRGSAQDRGKAAARAARDPVTLALGAGGGALAPARRPPARPVRPEVRTLAEEGVQLTPGQMAGGALRHIEDAATSAPILGPAITEARRRGVEGFNRAVLNRALRPLGEELPEGITAGHEAVAYAGDRISQGYRSALPEAGVRADPGFTESVAALTPQIQTLTPANAARLQSIVDERLSSRLGADGRLSGEMYQRVSSELGDEARRFSRSTDPDDQAMAQALEGINGALRDAAARQNPQFGERIRQLNEAWANITRAETAAAKGSDGVFTPAQYDQAVRAGSDTVRRRGYARGEALGQDLAGAARAVLPATVGDSGTATRGMVGMVLGGGGYAMGGPVGLAASAGGLYSLSRAYSPRAIELANQALARNIARGDQERALRDLAAEAANDPAARHLYEQVMARLARVGAVAGAAPEPVAGYAQP